MQNRSPAVLTALALGAVYVVWGSTYLAIAVSLETIPPLLLMGVRSVIAGAILYGIARVGGAGRPTASAWKNAALIGVLFFVIGHGLLSWGETRVPSGAAAVVIATEPLFIVLISRFGGVLAGGAPAVRPNARVWTAVVLGLAGVAAMMAHRAEGSLDSVGVLALLVASFSWSVGTFRVRSDSSPARAAGMQLISGGAILLVLSTALGEAAGVEVAEISLRSAGALAFLIVFGSVITFGAYVWLLPRIGPARVSTHTFVNPVIALALGVGLAGEQLGPTTLLATGLVLVAVLLLLSGSARQVATTSRAAEAGAPAVKKAA